jgi:hypothetical protein
MNDQPAPVVKAPVPATPAPGAPGPATLAPAAAPVPAAPPPNVPKAKEPVYIPPAGQPGTPTELVGGPEGWQFQIVDKERRAVKGFRVRMGSWAGTPAVAQLDPLFVRVPPAKLVHVEVARDGYVVGGLHVVAGELVNAVRIIFVREQSGGSLDKSDHYLSEWIGDPEDKPFKVLGDGQTRVIGVCGRHGAVKNAIALILDKP